MKKEKDAEGHQLKIELFNSDSGFQRVSTEDPEGKQKEDSRIIIGINSRCVPVGTKKIAPDGRNKKEMFKAKREFVKFRCSVYEKKLLQVKAKRSRLSVSEFCRRSIFNLEVKERLSDDHIEILKTLSKFHNNFKSIGNMFRKRDPQLTAAVYALAAEIKEQLKKVQK